MNTAVILIVLNGASLTDNFSMTYAGSYQTPDLCEQAFKDINADLDIFGGLHHKCTMVQTSLETEEDQE